MNQIFATMFYTGTTFRLLFEKFTNLKFDLSGIGIYQNILDCIFRERKCSSLDMQELQFFSRIPTRA